MLFMAPTKRNKILAAVVGGRLRARHSKRTIRKTPEQNGKATRSKDLPQLTVSKRGRPHGGK